MKAIYENAVKRLISSKRFRQFKIKAHVAHFADSPLSQRHFTPAELAKSWGVSVETIRAVFRNEDGVLKLGTKGTQYRRSYQTLRIPESVAQRVYKKLSA